MGFVMAESLRLTTLQKCRILLDHLGIPPSPYASSNEVIGLLRHKLIEKKDDPKTQELLRQLVAEMRDDDTEGSLPCPGCEDIAPVDMAATLASMLSGEAPAALSPRQKRHLIVALGVIVGIAAVGSGVPAGLIRIAATERQCQTIIARWNEGEYYRSLGRNSGASQRLGGSEKMSEFAQQYAGLPDNQKEAMLKEVCSASALEIADAIINGIGDLGIMTDVSAMYKGVDY